MIPFCPPLDYVKYARTAAWLRLGKVAVFSILAGLAVAVGLALPDAGQDAAAQGVSVRHGYSYTRMICQEWGQQPRWFYVRDPIAGSDWRNDGGWAIVLIYGGGSSTRTPAHYTRNFGVPGVGGATVFATVPTVQYDHPVEVSPVGNVRRFAYPLAAADPSTVVLAVVDNNRDGVITASGDNSGNTNEYYTDPVEYHPEVVTLVGGGSYIRWANMRWCR